VVKGVEIFFSLYLSHHAPRGPDVVKIKNEVRARKNKKACTFGASSQSVYRS
jgi:hypothetical protein